jgi:hypothetical protein
MALGQTGCQSGSNSSDLGIMNRVSTELSRLMTAMSSPMNNSMTGR